MAKTEFGEELDTLTYKTLKNSDFREVTLEREGRVLLKFAIANGFRNIQNLVQKLKRKRCDYDFVEVLACPSGCLNGGAQLRVQEVNVSSYPVSSCHNVLNVLIILGGVGQAAHPEAGGCSQESEVEAAGGERGVGVPFVQLVTGAGGREERQDRLDGLSCCRKTHKRSRY